MWEGTTKRERDSGEAGSPHDILENFRPTLVFSPASSRDRVEMMKYDDTAIFAETEEKKKRGKDAA